MSKLSKDSPEVVSFMTLFADLKHYSDETPEGLDEFAARDSSVEALCWKLSFAADRLEMAERSARISFATPVDPNFVAAWRDYKKRYESAVGDALFRELLNPLSSEESPCLSDADLNWEISKIDAEEQAKEIKEVIEFAWSHVEHESRGADQLEHVARVQDGISAWDRLVTETDFDLSGVLRRRALIPFVLVPRLLAARHGSTETPSILKNLQQAHKAFIFGAPYAALALMRSIMEAVLRDHYQAEGRDLNERIGNARHLPHDANGAALHRLRKRANAILHLDRENDEWLRKMDVESLEKEIVSLLFVLRALIEGAR